MSIHHIPVPSSDCLSPRHLYTFIFNVPQLVSTRSAKQKAQLDRMDAERMAAMLEEANYTIGHDNRPLKEDAHRENTVSPQAQRQRVVRPFSATVHAQQEKNKRDRQLREHFTREKRMEQQRLDRQGNTYERTMISAKLQSNHGPKPVKHTKKTSNAFTRLVRPLSTALLYNAAPPPMSSRKWTLAELDFSPSSKPSLAINLALSMSPR